MVTLANSPPNKKGKIALENAGVADFFLRSDYHEVVRRMFDQ
jgi:hypothetical protein